MKKVQLLLVFLSSFTISSINAQVDQKITLGETFELHQDERATLENADLAIVEVKVLEDSRCPIGTNCIWEGQIKLELTVESKKKIYTKEITMRGGVTGKTVKIAEHSIKVIGVRKIGSLGLKQYVFEMIILE